MVRALVLCVYIHHGFPRRIWSAFSESASMKQSPNKPDPENPARASRLAIGCHWRGVSDPFRWASWQSL